MGSTLDAVTGEGGEPPPAVTTTIVGHRSVLAVAGEIDTASIAVLRDAIGAALGAGAHDLWIDLSGTAFIDSTVVHALIDARARATALGRRLAVICPPGSVRRVLDVSGVAEALGVFADRESAHRAA